jgi:hypothetical protein
MGAVAAWLAKSVLMRSAAGPFLKRFWRPLLIGLAILGAFLWHQHAAHKAIADAYAKGKADEASHITKRALAIKEHADAVTGRISSALRSQNDEENRRIASDADAVRLRGPGKAACASDPRISAAASGSQQARGPARTPLARVPYPEWEQLIGMPFAPTVAYAEQHDLDRAEVLAWRDWYKKQSEAWAKLAQDSR